MKKALIKLSALATIGLVMASCSNEEANKKAAEADNAAIQTLVDSKTAAIDAEVSAACDAKVTEAAQAVADSLAKVKPVAAPVKKAPVKTTPAKTETPKPQGGLKGKSDQSTQESGGLKSKSDQAQQAQPSGGGLRGKRDNP